MEQWATDGMVKLHLAYSAVEDYPHAYVQHALAAAGEAVWPLLEGDGQIFVCGDGRNMAPAVRDTLIDICEAQRGGDREAASQWLEALIETGRYHQDVYGFGK
jgi:cytochrome P450 / NADPH-cytochrome P450 reductase